MRVQLLLVCGLLVSGCQPSAETIGAKVQVLLQQKVTATFEKQPVNVQRVVVIHESGNKYQGLADVLAFDAPLTVKLSVMADRSNVIYETSESEWSGFISKANQEKVKAVEGQYSNIATKNERVFSCFPDSLKSDKAVFAERLSTVVPVKSDGGFWFGSGCKAHSCTSEEAAWAIDKNTAKGYAVILSTGVAGHTFSVYGQEPENLPPVLLAWAVESGMTPYNSVVIRNGGADATKPASSRRSQSGTVP